MPPSVDYIFYFNSLINLIIRDAIIFLTRDITKFNILKANKKCQFAAPLIMKFNTTNIY